MAESGYERPVLRVLDAYGYRSARGVCCACGRPGAWRQSVRVQVEGARAPEVLQYRLCQACVESTEGERIERSDDAALLPGSLVSPAAVREAVDALREGMDMAGRIQLVAGAPDGSQSSRDFDRLVVCVQDALRALGAGEEAERG